MTTTDPESNAHRSFGDVIAVPLNMADTMKILVATLFHIHYAVNGQRRRAFSAVESEVPASAATVTMIDS